MPLTALGRLTVPVPGTKVAVSSIIPAGVWSSVNGPYKGHGIMLQVLPTNTDRITVYQLQADGSYNEVAFLAAPTDNFIPSFSAALTIAPNSIVMSDLYVDAAVADEGVIVDLLVS